MSVTSTAPADAVASPPLSDAYRLGAADVATALGPDATRGLDGAEAVTVSCCRCGDAGPVDQPRHGRRAGDVAGRRPGARGADGAASAAASAVLWLREASTLVARARAGAASTPSTHWIECPP
jgi:hypothetical protein